MYVYMIIDRYIYRQKKVNKVWFCCLEWIYITSHHVCLAWSIPLPNDLSLKVRL